MERHHLEEQMMWGQRIQGPINLCEETDDDKRTMYSTEARETNKVVNTIPAVKIIIARSNNLFKIKAVYRLHSDRAQELCGEKMTDAMAEIGVQVTAMSGHDPNANGRAERGVRWIKEKTRTYLQGTALGNEF